MPDSIEDSLDKDHELIDRILAGDRNACEEFVHRFTGLVRRVLRTSLRLSEDQGNDAFQHIFLELMEQRFRRLRLWEGNALLRSYLVVVVKHIALDFLRAERSRRGAVSRDCEDTQAVDPRDPRLNPEENLIEKEKQTRLRHAAEVCRARLSSRHERILDLRRVNGMKYREIAAQLNMTLSNVGVTLRRAEARFKACLRESLRESDPDRFKDAAEPPMDQE